MAEPNHLQPDLATMASQLSRMMYAQDYTLGRSILRLIEENELNGRDICQWDLHGGLDWEEIPDSQAVGSYVPLPKTCGFSFHPHPTIPLSHELALP